MTSPLSPEVGMVEQDLRVAPFQARVQPWMLACFGAAISADMLERKDRFLEEALERAQARDKDEAAPYPAERAHALVDYVFGRPPGEPGQETGGVMVTLAALSLPAGVDMHEAGETELARIWTKVEAIRAKQAAKPTGSALPVAQSTSRDLKPAASGGLEGWVLVPREPLPEMVGAWWRVKNGHHFHDEPAPTDTSDYAAYRAMIDAAPSTPPQVEREGSRDDLEALDLDAMEKHVRELPPYEDATLDPGIVLRPIATNRELLSGARAIDRLLLVIESAVRHADPSRHEAVLAALKANRTAISNTLSKSEGTT